MFSKPKAHIVKNINGINVPTIVNKNDRCYAAIKRDVSGRYITTRDQNACSSRLSDKKVNREKL